MKSPNVVTEKIAARAAARAASSPVKTPSPVMKTSPAPRTAPTPKTRPTPKIAPALKTGPAPKTGLIDQAPPPGRVSSDFALGACGCGLAFASASFALYMNMHGPAPHQPGNDFSVFAQLAPRATPARKPSEDEQLDLTPTASIAPPAPGQSRPPAMTSMVLQSATVDAATITVAGRSLSVRVGDSIPGGGEVLAIYPGRRPVVKTSRGTIVASGQ